MVNYEVVERELVKKVGPIGKIFLKKAMATLGIDEINEDNVEDILEILELNPAMKPYIEELKRELLGG